MFLLEIIMRADKYSSISIILKAIRAVLSRGYRDSVGVKRASNFTRHPPTKNHRL